MVLNKWVMLGCSSALSVSLVSPATFAQTPQQASPPPALGTAQLSQPTAAQKAAVTPLETIVVTAQKRSQRLQNVPRTVTAITGATLNKLSLTQFQDVAALVPGLELTNTLGSYPTATLRGISYNALSGTVPSVDTYFNEAILPIPSVAFRSLFDTQQVEVLAGPEGALRGRTSPGGSITVTTKQPDTELYTGYFNQQLSDLGLVHTEGAVNIPVIQNQLAVRIAGVFDYNTVNEGKDLLTGKDEDSRTRALRESVLWTPTDDISIDITHQDLKDRYNFDLDLVGGPGDFGQPTITPDDRATLAQINPNNSDTQDLTVVNASYRLNDNLNFDYVGSYLHDDVIVSHDQDPADTIPDYVLFQNTNTRLDELTQELRLQSAGRDFWNYMFGVYYDNQRVLTTNVQNQALIGYIPGPPQPGELNGVVDVRSPSVVTDLAFFTAQTFQLDDADELQAAFRWGTTSEYRQDNLKVFLNGNQIVSEQLIMPQYVKADYHYPTGSVTFTHHFEPDLMAYAAWSHGYRPGGANVATVASSVPIEQDLIAYNSEESDEYEIGAKGTFFQNRLQIRADAFYQRFDGYLGYHPQVYFRSSPSEPPPYTNTLAGGAFNGNASVPGFEVQTDARILANWTASLNGAWNNAHFDNASSPCNDYLGIGIPNDPPPGVGTGNIRGNKQVSYCILNGPISDAPPWSIAATTEYVHPVFGLDGFIRALAKYQAGYFQPDLLTNADPMLLVNAYLGVRTPNGHWELQMFIKNLFDRVTQIYQSPYQVTAGNNLYNSGYYQVYQNPPREIGFSLRYTF